MESKVLKLTPVLFERSWGGRRLGQLKGMPNALSLGESWEVSVHPEGVSQVRGQALSSVIDGRHLPYLVKFIDTESNLSVQVHPDNEFAQEHEGTSGKTECWIILEAGHGAGIYLGVKDGVTRQRFHRALLEREDISLLLNYYPVGVGDFFLVPAGMLHAIGAKVFLLEIQQSSGITYRAWDWNRFDQNGHPRKLHQDKAMQVINFDKEFNGQSAISYQRNVFGEKWIKRLVEHPDFSVDSHTLVQGEELSLESNETSGRYSSILCLSGQVTIQGGACNECLATFESSLLIRGRSHPPFRIKPLSSTATIVVVY